MTSDRLEKWKGRFIKGIQDPAKAKSFIYSQISQTVDKKFQFGRNVFDYEWDVLCILDACRSDLFDEAVSDHPVGTKFDKITNTLSMASMTRQWLQRTVDDTDSEILGNTWYVSGNPLITTVLTDQFQGVDHVWQESVHPEAGSAVPAAVTDCLIERYREDMADRYIAHYSDPHAPFVSVPGKYDSLPEGERRTQEVWAGLERGEYEYEEVWADYRESLEHALDEVSTIIEDLDARIAVTSDHGNALGEWGIYGHPEDHASPVIRRVPWAEAMGEGKGTYEIQGYRNMGDTGDKFGLKDHLQNLGYL